MKRQATNRIPQSWQLEPDRITSESVQFWCNGVYAYALTNEEAKQFVTKGRAFVMTGQAIGSLSSGRTNS